MYAFMQTIIHYIKKKIHDDPNITEEIKFQQFETYKQQAFTEINEKWDIS